MLFTFNLLKEKGTAAAAGGLSVGQKRGGQGRFDVAYDLTGANDQELPLTLALMPVLSPAHTDAEHFDDQTLQPPVASGPYVVAEVKPGERLVLKRDPNYWGKDLPLQRGLYNADELRFDYYRDAGAMFEAFKAGLYDYRVEDDPTLWTSAYDFPALKDGRVVRETIPNGLPKGRERIRLQSAAAVVRRCRGCARRWRRCSTSRGSTPISMTASTGAR